jgi:hypothetical protein
LPSHSHPRRVMAAGNRGRDLQFAAHITQDPATCKAWPTCAAAPRVLGATCSLHCCLPCTAEQYNATTQQSLQQQELRQQEDRSSRHKGQQQQQPFPDCKWGQTVVVVGLLCGSALGCCFRMKFVVFGM